MNKKTSDIIVGKPFTFTGYKYSCGSEHGNANGGVFVKSSLGIVSVNSPEYWGDPPVEFHGFEYVELEVKERLHTFQELPIGLAVNAKANGVVPFIKLSNTSYIDTDKLEDGPSCLGVSSGDRVYKPLTGTLEVKS